MIAVVTNPVVGSLYAERAVTSLRSADFDTVVCEVPDGERYKTLDTVSGLYTKFVEAGLDRQATVVALGGGVVGDMAGFAAATYLRGIRVVQVPTTLLAMVDASVGGKTGVDLPAGKNLVGSFKQPALVVTDPNVLASLPDRERRCGMAELIKHAMLDAPRLFSRLQQGPVALDPTVLAEAIRVKVDVVNDDPLEQGKRAILNLGHTFAHGFERVSQYTVPHGVAVGVGLKAAARLGREIGLCEESLEESVTTVLCECNLPTSLDDLPAEQVREAMSTDKKRVGKRLRFVVPKAIGEVEVVESPDEAAVTRALLSVLR